MIVHLESYRVMGRKKASTKEACKRRGRVYRKGFTRSDGTRVGPTCAKKAKRRR